jgi:hypothetical protein
MNLGFGEYLFVSNCINMPYEASKIIGLLRSLELEIKNTSRIIYFNTKLNCINYDRVMEGIGTFNKDLLDYDDLSCYPLSSIDVTFIDGIFGRISIMFLDEFSYKISFTTNFAEKFEECNNKKLKKNNAKKVEHLAFRMFTYLEPVYSVIGVEMSCEGIVALKSDKTLLPVDKVYLSYDICDSNIKKIAAELKFTIDLKSGIYLRNSDVDDYAYQPNYDIRNRIIGDNTHFWENKVTT